MKLALRVKNAVRVAGKSDPGRIFARKAIVPTLALCFCGFITVQNNVVAQDKGRRSVEREGDIRSPAREQARGGDRDQESRFRPQTKREAELYAMILELRREISELKRRSNDSSRDRETDRRDQERTIRRNGDAPQRGETSTRDQMSFDSFVLNPRWQKTKDGGVFRAYDKNGDQVVSLDEWLAMTNGNISDARRRLQTERMKAADPNGDLRLTPAEFIYWYSHARHFNTGERRSDAAARDGDRSRPSPRDGDVRREGPRDARARDGDRG